LVNTVTLYRSPVRLVSHASEETSAYSLQAISRARKKMMAEIALAGDEIIIDNVSYSRNDASALLDFITEDAWKVHHIIYTYKGLLHFLEKEEFNNEELKKADAYLYNTKFVEAVSPYFAHSFNAVSSMRLRENDFEGLMQLLNYQGYILPEHSHEAYQKIRTYLDELNYTLRNLSWEKFASDERVLHFIFSDEWKRFINKLPSSFTGLRDELAEQMTGIVLRFQHKATWYYLHQVLVQLRGVETNDFNRSEVERIDKVIYENSRIEGGKKIVSREGDGFNWRSVWWIVWLVLIIVRATTCNNSNKSDFKFDDNGIRQIQKAQSTHAAEQRNEPLLLDFLDSLSTQRSIEFGSSPQEIKTGDQPFTSFANDFPKDGSDTIHIANNTAHNCVALYIGGPSLSGSVYEGALPDIAAVYIKQGETYSFQMTPSYGKFYFLFGDEWGKLNPQAELPVSGDPDEYYPDGRKQLVFFYEFFRNKKTIEQKYLQQALYAEEASSNKNKARFNYLNNPYDATLNQATEIKLQETNNKLSISAKGSLGVKEEKQDELKEMSEKLKEFKVRKIVPLKK